MLYLNMILVLRHCPVPFYTFLTRLKDVRYKIISVL